MKLHVTVGLIHYMVYLGNGLLGTEDEIDRCFSKKGGQNDWENLYGFRGSLQKAWKSGMIFLFPFWERRRPHKSTTACLWSLSVLTALT